MNKDRISELMSTAAEQLNNSVGKDYSLFKDSEKGVIHKSYNGQIASLSVSILMIGLRPTIAVYYQDTEDKEGVSRKKVLEIIARMLKKKDAETLVREVLESSDTAYNQLKTDILNNAVALKYVLRTFKLE